MSVFGGYKYQQHVAFCQYAWYVFAAYPFGYMYVLAYAVFVGHLLEVYLAFVVGVKVDAKCFVLQFPLCVQLAYGLEKQFGISGAYAIGRGYAARVCYIELNCDVGASLCG